MSDSNRGQENVQGKFAEAADKVADFYQQHALTVGGRELLNIYEAGIYPGLGMLKKWSIKNHLEVMATLLEERSV